MTSGADLFVVCKQCGSEVSPYITECPYCGHRLRRRAPKLPRANPSGRPARGGSRFASALGLRRGARGAPTSAGYGSGRWETTRPYATIVLVALSAAMWITVHAEPLVYAKSIILGPLGGDWWRLFAYQFAYANGVYAFCVIFATGIFGWLVERRHGPAVVLALFLGAGVLGGLLTLAVYPLALAAGGNAGALALLCAWAGPDLRMARGGGVWEGDLLGAGVYAVLLLVLPFGIYEASWLAGLTGALLGLLIGMGLPALAGRRPGTL